LNGHRRDYAGVTGTFSHGLNMHATICALCAELHLDRYGWFEVDHTKVRRVDETVESRIGVEFVMFPPKVPAGVGEIRLLFERKHVARVRVQLCGVERRGVIVHVEVKPSYRRRRMATVLLACAMARGLRYHWSTVPVSNTVEARAFCAALMAGYDVQLGEPHFCSHMLQANGELG
jgi:ribosomal protein S18 acetylase RimI-like enzyme